MPDPRILRTRLHILDVLRDMLSRPGEAITFSSIAVAAQVSRRTLYTHWGSVETAVADATYGSQDSVERVGFLAVASDTMRKLPAVLRELEELRGTSRE